VHGTERVLEFALEKQGESAFDGLGPMQVRSSYRRAHGRGHLRGPRLRVRPAGQVLRPTQTFGPGVALDDAPCSPGSRAGGRGPRHRAAHRGAEREQLPGETDLDTVELQGLGRRPTVGLEGMYRRMTAVR
jgi:hypothetical protein